MKCLDTNALVRIITGDDQALAAQAIAAVEAGAQNDFSIIDAVLVELCFILEFQVYRMQRTDIADAVAVLIAAPQIVVSNTTKAALKLYRERPKLDYVDCLLITLGGKRGVVTLDKNL